MKNREEQLNRLSLTLLFAGLVFVVLFVTMLVITGVIILLVRQDVLEPGQSPARFNGYIAVIALISIVVGTVLAATAGRIPLRTVNAIINAMNRLASGDYKTRLSFSGPLAKYPVARELTDSFNKMAAELESTETLRADFINNFSHEFKTPIVSIAGFAKLLKHGKLSEGERREYLDIIESESLRLSEMATSVLNATKVENQEILTNVTRYNLSEQLRECVLILESRWEPKGLELRLEFDEYDICANEELLKQVWLNLLDNAFKFTPAGGWVELGIDEEQERLRVSVVNSGSYIPPEKREDIFRKFYQADESHATQGNGIGLAVVRRAVGLHRGEVFVDSGDDRTAFIVSLPKEQR